MAVYLDVKESMKDAIENPIKHKELYAKYGRKPTKGILLYGPPGNGKTMIGKAVASSISELYDTEESGFIYIKGPEILNMYVGASEEKIRSIFSTARDFKKRTNCPAIIFIDEAEAILSKRGSGKSSDVDKTIVPQFLSEMDGLEDSGAIVILTTNRPDMLDSAIVREGRIDKKIKVSSPDIESVEHILKMNFKNVPCEIDTEKMAKSAARLMFDSSLEIYDITTEKGSNLKFRMSNILNGAMVASIVNDSVSRAIKRDLDSGNIEPTGVTLDDVHETVMHVFDQNSKMDHQHLFDDLDYDLQVNSGDKIKNYKPSVKKEKAVTHTS